MKCCSIFYVHFLSNFNSYCVLEYIINLQPSLSFQREKDVLNVCTYVFRTINCLYLRMFLVAKPKVPFPIVQPEPSLDLNTCLVVNKGTKLY